MKTCTSLLALPLFVLSLSGCPTGEGGAPNVKVSPDNYCSEVAAVACHNMFNCCTGLEIEDSLGITISTTEAECRRDVELICEDNLNAVMWAMAKGTVVLLDNEAKVCLQSLLLVDDACFSHVSEVPWARWCEGEHWRGTVQPGQDCLYSFECVENAFCAADRKCKALPQRGQDCAGTVCADPLFCNVGTGLCEDRKSNGMSCYDDDWCSAGLYCEYGQEGPGTCQPLKALGASCGGHYQCDTTYCIPGLCTTGEECFKHSDCMGTCSHVGTACSSDYDCPGLCSLARTPCYDSYECNGEETCIPTTCQQQCTGQPACGKAWYELDYCTNTLGLFLDSDGMSGISEDQ